jgi:ribosomal-protein-serine acetyltransferase
VISIRLYEPEDAPLIVEAAHESTAEVFPWLPWCHPDYSLAESSAFIDAQIAARESGTAFEFAVRDGARFVGGCGFNQIQPYHRVANLGYWVRTSATGRGVATASVRLVAGWGFANTNLERLEILVGVGNPRSQRVAEKSGAAREGVLRARLFLHDRSHDAVVYSLVRGDVPGPRPDPGAHVAASQR